MTAVATSLALSVWIGVQLYTHQTLSITVSVLLGHPMKVLWIYFCQIIYNLFSALFSTVYHCGLGSAYELESAVFGSGSGYQSITGNNGHMLNYYTYTD